MLEAAIEAGAEDVELDEDGPPSIATPTNCIKSPRLSKRKFGEPRASRILWRAKSDVPVE